MRMREKSFPYLIGVCCDLSVHWLLSDRVASFLIDYGSSPKYSQPPTTIFINSAIFSVPSVISSYFHQFIWLKIPTQLPEICEFCELLRNALSFRDCDEGLMFFPHIFLFAALFKGQILFMGQIILRGSIINFYCFESFTDFIEKDLKEILR